MKKPEDIKPFSVEKEPGKSGFAEFLKKVEGWRRNSDGENLCPGCWEVYLRQFPEQDEKGRPVRQWALEDSSPLPKFLQEEVSRFAKEDKEEPDDGLKRMGFKTIDGWWFVFCEKCGKSVSVPFSPDESY